MHRLVLALVALTASPAVAANVDFFFEDDDFDGVWNVSFEVDFSDGNVGLGAYNIQVVDLDKTWVDNTTVKFEPAPLGGLGVDFVTRGFETFLDAPIGNGEYSAVGSQFNALNPILGIGQVPVFVDMFELAGSVDVDLGVPALIGRLTVPGSGGYDIRGFLAPSAQVIDFDGRFASFSDAEARVVGPRAGDDPPLPPLPIIPEPATAALAGLAAALAVTARPRR